MERYLGGLPPSMGWYRKAGGESLYHLVSTDASSGYATFCGQQWSEKGLQSSFLLGLPVALFCVNCRRKVDKWRRANAVEPQSNTEEP